MNKSEIENKKVNETFDRIGMRFNIVLVILSIVWILNVINFVMQYIL